MSYTKTNWQTGDTITAEKLNHAEQGIYDNSISSDILIVHAVTDEQTEVTTLDKTWQEINDAILAVIYIEHSEPDTGEVGLLKSQINFTTYSPEDGYIVSSSVGGGSSTYHTDSANGYPSDDSGQDNGGGN